MLNNADITLFMSSAGTGKTTTLLSKVLQQCVEHNVAPSEVAFVTFTRAGVETAQTNFLHSWNSLSNSRSAIALKDLVWFKTIHSLVYKQMELNEAFLYTRLSEQEFNDTYGYNAQLTLNDTRKRTRDTRYLELYEELQLGYLSRDKFAEMDIDSIYYNTITKDFEEFLESKHLYTFNRMLLKSLEGAKRVEGIKVLCIDEAQDLTKWQWKIIDFLFADVPTVFVAGDEKQSIFTYNGAYPEMLKIIKEQRNTKSIPLSTVWRSGINIINYAEGYADLLDYRLTGKAKAGTRKRGKVIHLPSIDEVLLMLANERQELLKPNNKTKYMLLGRTNRICMEIMDRLADYLIPYTFMNTFCFGGSVYNRLQKYFRFRELQRSYATLEPSLRLAFDVFKQKYSIEDFNAPITACNMFTPERANIYYNFIDYYGYDTLLKARRQKIHNVVVATIHSVKGLEAENVVFFTDVPATVREKWDSTVAQEEFRLCYVAATRATDNLYCTQLHHNGSYEDYLGGNQ